MDKYASLPLALLRCCQALCIFYSAHFTTRTYSPCALIASAHAAVACGYLAANRFFAKTSNRVQRQKSKPSLQPLVRPRLLSILAAALSAVSVQMMFHLLHHLCTPSLLFVGYTLTGFASRVAHWVVFPRSVLRPQLVACGFAIVAGIVTIMQGKENWLVASLWLIGAATVDGCWRVACTMLAKTRFACGVDTLPWEMHIWGVVANVVLYVCGWYTQPHDSFVVGVDSPFTWLLLVIHVALSIVAHRVESLPNSDHQQDMVIGALALGLPVCEFLLLNLPVKAPQISGLAMIVSCYFVYVSLPQKDQQQHSNSSKSPPVAKSNVTASAWHLVIVCGVFVFGFYGLGALENMSPGVAGIGTSTLRGASASGGFSSVLPVSVVGTSTPGSFVDTLDSECTVENTFVLQVSCLERLFMLQSNLESVHKWVISHENEGRCIFVSMVAWAPSFTDSTDMMSYQTMVNEIFKDRVVWAAVRPLDPFYRQGLRETPEPALFAVAHELAIHAFPFLKERQHYNNIPIVSMRSYTKLDRQLVLDEAAVDALRRFPKTLMFASSPIGRGDSRVAAELFIITSNYGMSSLVSLIAQRGNNPLLVNMENLMFRTRGYRLVLLPSSPMMVTTGKVQRERVDALADGAPLFATNKCECVAFTCYKCSKCNDHTMNRHMGALIQFSTWESDCDTCLKLAPIPVHCDHSGNVV